MGATDSTVMLGRRLSAGIGTVFVVTISSISGMALSRSMAGPEKTPWVQARVTRLTSWRRSTSINATTEPAVATSSSKMITSLLVISPMMPATRTWSSVSRSLSPAATGTCNALASLAARLA